MQPTNLLLYLNGTVTLCDSELSANWDMTCYTEEKKEWYNAPEEFVGGRELKSNVWSLGIVLMELAEKENPLSAYEQGEIKEVVTNKTLPSLSREKWSDAFVDFVDKCLVTDVGKRWSVKQLLEVCVVSGA